MSEVKVSVIVPVYNAEKHLRQCLTSIANQSLKDIEIICVDDGSTDGSPEILKEYASRDSRFQIYFQQNLYAGVARNNGMTHASGKYLAFWDSDDYFDKKALEKMYKRCEKDLADVCICSGRQYLEDAKIEVPVPAYLVTDYLPDHIPFSAKEAENYILNITNDAPWNKLYRKSYIDSLKLQFQARRNDNDAYFVCMAICLAKRITVVNDELIIYRKNQTDNLVTTLSKANLSPYETWIDIKHSLEDNAFMPKRSYDNKALNMIVYHLHYTSSYSAFIDSVKYLKETGLKEMGLELHDAGYYFSSWKEECLRHLIDDEPEDFLAFFAFKTYIQLYTSDARRYRLQRIIKTFGLSVIKEKFKRK